MPVKDPPPDIFAVFPADTPEPVRYGPEPPPAPGALITLSGEIQLWDQLEGESSLAYGAFLVFLNLGPGRTLTEAFRISRNKPNATQVNGGFNAWKTKWKWVLRATAYDAWYRRRNFQEQEDVILNSLAKRTEQATEYRDRMFNLADSLIEKAERMLQFPLEEVSRATIQDGKTTIVTIKPLKWGIGDIATLLTLAERMRKIGLGDDSAPTFLKAEQIIEQLAEQEGLNDQQKAEALANLKQLVAEPKTGRSSGN